jgi:hypothetical protein
MAVGAFFTGRVLAALQDPDWRAISALAAFAVSMPV